MAGNYSIRVDESNYTETIEKLRNSGAKAVFLAMSPTMATNFLQQCVDNQYTHILFLGTRAWNDEEFINFARSNDKIDVAFCAEEPEAVQSELSTVFLDAFAAKYGTEEKPSGRTAAAFDAYMLALKAIENAYTKLQETDVEDLASKAGSEGEAKAIREAYNNALEQGIPTGTQIKDALKAIEDFQGASGVINYDGNNEATKTITIDYIQGTEMPVYVTNE